MLIERNKICFEWNTNTWLYGGSGYTPEIKTPWSQCGVEPEPSVFHDTVILDFNEEGNSSLESILREEGAFSLKLGDSKKAIHK